MNRAICTAAAVLLTVCAARPTPAQRRPVPERVGPPVRGNVTPRGNQARRTVGARPAFDPATPCEAVPLTPLDVGDLTWYRWAGGPARTWIDIPATTGAWTTGKDSHITVTGRRPQVGALAVEAPGAWRMTIRVVPPARLRPVNGTGRDIPFAGEWAVSTHPQAGFERVPGARHVMAVPPSGRVYIRYGGRVAFAPDGGAAQKLAGGEYAADWSIRVRVAAYAGSFVRDCVHATQAPVSVVLHPPAAACTVTMSPDPLDFGTAQRSRTVPGTGFPHLHAVTVDPTTTPADVTLTDATNDHFVGTPAGQAGWLAIRTGEQEAFAIFAFPATVDHEAPPDDATAADITKIPYAPQLAYYEGTSSTGDDFTEIDLGSCQGCQKSHRIPPNTRHEYAPGGTITFDQASGGGNIGRSAIPGAFRAIITVSVACS